MLGHNTMKAVNSHVSERLQTFMQTIANFYADKTKADVHQPLLE